jgi:hypothetical protein
MSKLLSLLTIWYLSKSLNVLIIWCMSVHSSIRLEKTTKANSLSDDELELS